MRKKHSIENFVNNEQDQEIILKGRSVSRGVGIGKVLVLQGKNRQFYRVKLKKEKIENEILRFQAAVGLAISQIKTLSKIEEDKNQNQISIFQTHLLFLEDKSFINKIKSKIEDQHFNAEWAVDSVAEEYIAKYKSIPDNHLSEKYIDLEDISERLLNALGGGKRANPEFENKSVIIAKELYPSTLIELSQSKPAAIITENGGWTSHTFILARELNIPAITGIKAIWRSIQTNQTVAVDGFNGKVFINPNTESIEKFEMEIKDFQAELAKENLPVNDGKITTLDGIEINILVNLDLPQTYKQSREAGARGIGLYRSEYLFNQNKGFPSEAEQIKNYRQIARIVGKDSVIIRTFDLNNEHFNSGKKNPEKNPALGLRAIRWGLKNEKNLRTQCSAILQASFQNNINIVLPMISDVAEIIRVKQILKQEKNKLRKKNIDFGDPKIGAMIEVPSAVLTIEEVLNEVDFINLGTNDLVQYLLAVDRDNEEVADWFRTLHPAVIKSIKKVAEAAQKSGKPLIVCGEMAGTPMYAAILIGLGVNNLSMNLNSIRRVRNTVTNIAYEEAKQVTEELQTLKTSDEMENFVSEKFKIIWKHLFNESTLPAKSKSL